MVPAEPGSGGGEDAVASVVPTKIHRLPLGGLLTMICLDIRRFLRRVHLLDGGLVLLVGLSGSPLMAFLLALHPG
jgi:hypothetical protein